MKLACVFIIEVDNKELSFIVYEPFELACQIVHKELRHLYPNLFTDKWQDLMCDVEEGCQTCYEVPVSILSGDGTHFTDPGD